jgi:glycerol kinase
MSAYLLAIDQGTTSSRAIIFNERAEPLSQHQIDLKQFYPNDGWVEQDPEEIWQHTLSCCQYALKKIHLPAQKITAAGITNQRETTIVWDKKTGIPIYPAIVWQDRRTVEICHRYIQHAIHSKLQYKTGLLLDPYFSASKIIWLLENISGARKRAENNELAFGTIDTFLLWRLTRGKVHATDATNASRTLLFNIRSQCWDEEILSAFNIPANILPVVLDSAADFGVMDKEFFDAEVPVYAMLGDQQAATVGQACFTPGMMKATYGTGGFLLLNTGENVLQSSHRLLSTVAYRIEGKTTYGLEGSIFSAGTTIKWLRDNLKFIPNSAAAETMAETVSHTGGVYLVPAFTGLGAPFWDPEARAALLGLTRNSSIAHIVRAGLEAVCYQTRDLLECMKLDGVLALQTLRVDGGMSVNNWLMRFLASIVNLTVQRPMYVETTALGVAFFAGLQSGVYQSLAEIAELWQANTTWTPTLPDADYEKLYQGWKNALARIVTQPTDFC